MNWYRVTYKDRAGKVYEISYPSDSFRRLKRGLEAMGYVDVRAL